MNWWDCFLIMFFTILGAVSAVIVCIIAISIIVGAYNILENLKDKWGNKDK